jgi:uncharacterized protein (TIGR00369 family)
MVHAAHNRCFGCGRESAGGLLLEFLLATDGSVVCLPTIPDRFEGHPGYLHGGIIATLLDEAMSKAVRACGFVAMTRQLEVEYLRPVPSGVELRIEGKLVHGEGRKHWAEARILSEKSMVLATGKGLFVEVRTDRLTAGRPEDRPANS